MSSQAGIRAILSDRAVTTVVAVAFVLMLGGGLVLPILPLYARSFGVGYTETGILVAAYGGRGSSSTSPPVPRSTAGGTHVRGRRARRGSDRVAADRSCAGVRSRRRLLGGRRGGLGARYRGPLQPPAPRRAQGAHGTHTQHLLRGVQRRVRGRQLPRGCRRVGARPRRTRSSSAPASPSPRPGSTCGSSRCREAVVSRPS